MVWKFDVEEKGISGVYEILLEPRGDDRGFFMRTYDQQIFRELGLDRDWVQENHSRTEYSGTIRGLHFQYSPDCETKMLRAITGEAYFAIADLRKDSPTLGQWTSVTLSSQRPNILIVPKGCANGMCSLTDNFNLVYKIDTPYAPHNEDVLKWNDPDLCIEWPIKEPRVISAKDSEGKSLKQILSKSEGGIVP